MIHIYVGTEYLVTRQQEYGSFRRQWEYPTYSVQCQMSTPAYSMMFPQPQLPPFIPHFHSSPKSSMMFPQMQPQIRQPIPPTQCSQHQQRNHNTSFDRSNVGQTCLGTVPHLANLTIPSSNIVTTIATDPSLISTLQSSDYTYLQSTAIDTLTAVQCENSGQHRSLYSVCGHPTCVASFQVGLSR